MLGEITGVQECAPVEVADCYKRRITKHARPKEYPLPSAAMPRVRARLMAAFETIRNALQHPPLSLRNLVLACDHHPNPHTKTAPSHNFSDWTFFYVMVPRCHGMFPSFGEQSSWPLFQLQLQL